VLREPIRRSDGESSLDQQPVDCPDRNTDAEHRHGLAETLPGRRRERVRPSLEEATLRERDFEENSQAGRDDRQRDPRHRVQV